MLIQAFAFRQPYFVGAGAIGTKSGGWRVDNCGDSEK
jgi:hypothetical protein